MYEPLSHSTEKEHGKLLTIVGDPDIGELCIFGKGMYLSIFYCLCYEMYISIDMLSNRCWKRYIHT